MGNRFLRFGCLILFQWFCLSAAAQNNALTISGPSVVCAGDCFTLTANWTGAPDPNAEKYAWSVVAPGAAGPVLISDTSKQIVYCTSAPGAYVFTLRVQNNNGTVLTTTFTVIAMNSAQPIIVSDNKAPCNNPDAGGNDLLNCERLCPFTTVTYSVVFPGGVPGLNSPLIIWEVSGALSYTVNPAPANSVTVNWGATGSGSVSVLTFGGQSTTMCSGEASLCVTIIEAPKADFATVPAPPAAEPLRVCKGQEVFFENMSTGAGSYTWLFGDTQEQSNQANPIRQFDLPGLHPVRLVASSNCLCADTITRWIEVIDAEAPRLDCIGTVCPGAIVTYSASNACPPYQWSVSADGLTLAGGNAATDSITIQWTGGPAGMISLLAQPCSGAACPEPVQFRIPIITAKSGIRGRERVCPGAEEVYSVEPFGGTGFEWGISGGGEI
ncbi:MAG: PKD domain-containing protein, partial [Saprospiraceae bacterium]